MAVCKSCGAKIRWIKTASGKSMPVNDEEVMYWQSSKGKATIVTPNGEVVKANLEGILNTATGIGYISHFATCPNADKHRRR